MNRSNWTLAALSAVAVLLALPAAAQNLLPNPTFDTNLNGWAYDPANVSWSSFDAEGSPKSGSALVLNSRNDFAPVTLKTPCMNSAGNVGTKLFIPSGQGVNGTVRVSFNWYLATTGCTGSPIKSDPLEGYSPVTFDQWMSVRQFGSTYPFANYPGQCPAFCGTPPETKVQIEADVSKAALSASTFRAYLDDFYLRTTCTPNAQTLCLNGARFKVTADWETASGSGHAAGLQLNDDTGAFSFFDTDNTELVVKVLNACADPFNRFWVFGAGLTNVLVTLNVEDTQNGTVRTYVNPQGTAFVPIQDTAAFATCP